MIIQCDACQTRFKLPDEKLKPGGVKVRCTSCEQIFHVPGPEPESPPTPEPVAPPAETGSSEFDFSDLNLDGNESEEAEGEEFDFNEFNMEDLGTDDTPETKSDGPAETKVSAEPETTTAEVKDIGDELPDFDLPDDFAFDAEDDTEDDQLADFSPEDLSDDTEEFSMEIGDGEEEPEIDDIFGENDATGEESLPIEPDEPQIGGDLGKTFELDADLSDLPDLDQENFGVGTEDEFSFDASTEESGLSGLDDDEAGPVEFAFGAESESEDQAVALDRDGPDANDFIFEESPTATSAPPSAQAPSPQAPPKVTAEVPPSTSGPKPTTSNSRRQTGNARLKKRKKGNRTIPLFLLLLLVIGGAYAYLAQQKGTWDPQILFQYAQQMLNQKPPENPTANIELRNLRSNFVSNQNAGQLFTISGEAVNQYQGSRSTIAVKGIIYDSAGKAVMQQTVFCGNPLDEAALRTLPFAKIEETMNNQFGDSLSNLDVATGSSVPFTIVFKNLPGEVAEFNVQVADSRPGTQ